jgi:lipoprotein-anchoring transpeptidase ErfK/SrfK
MTTRLTSLLLPVLAGLFLLNSCAKNENTVDANGVSTKPFVNPHPPGTYEHFMAEPSYPKTYNIYKNSELYAQTNAGNSQLILDTSKQRAKLLNGDQVVMDYPISSGRRSHPTPKGRFAILEKIVDKSSNRYGRIYDADGKVVNSDGDAFTDTIPEGGKFVGAPMKYWMRLTWDGVGHHIGPIPSSRGAVSHGCIRGYYKAMPEIYAKVKVGTVVTVQ